MTLTHPNPFHATEMTVALQDKTIVHAMLVCGRQWLGDIGVADEQAQLLAAEIGSHASPAQVALAMVTAAQHITRVACDNIGRSNQIDPQAIPGDMDLVVAYGLFLLAGMHSELKLAGVTTDFREVGVILVRNFYQVLAEPAATKHLLEAIETFQVIATSNSQIIQQWHENLAKLTRIYLLQTANLNPQLEHVQCIPLFGSMLSGLLAVAQGQ